MSWVPYLLNLFLEDYKDAQDLGTEFHYSCLITLIAFMGWQEPRYVFFCTRPKPQRARYLLLRARPKLRNKKENRSIFEGYLHDLQEYISNTWRITPEVFTRYAYITKFQATRQTMWIQAKNDLAKQWIHMCYCIIEGDIYMVISKWPEEWRIPAITQEVPERIAKKEAEQGETQPPEIQVPKKPRTSPSKQTQENEGPNKIGNPEGGEGGYTVGQREAEIG
jgi:hypothetical protein